jgi:hypothetical protein
LDRENDAVSAFFIQAGSSASAAPDHFGDRRDFQNRSGAALALDPAWIKTQRNLVKVERLKDWYISDFSKSK